MFHLGYYAYANGTHHENQSAVLLSAREIPPGNFCTILHYYMLNPEETLTLSSHDYVTSKDTDMKTTIGNVGRSTGYWYEITAHYESSNVWRVRLSLSFFKI